MSREPSSTATSCGLLDGARAFDTEAWTRLVDLYGPTVVKWCRRRGLAEHDAADVSQDVFHAVARNLERFRRDRPGDTFRGWLHTIVRNKIRDHFRRAETRPHVGGSTLRHRLANEPNPESPTAPPSIDSSSTDHELLWRALRPIRSTVRAKTWQAFWRTTVDGRSAVEVADELDMQPGAVRVAKSRVLQRLREELGDRDPDAAV